MAIVKMRKLTLIGLVADKNKILRSLARLRCADVKKADEIEGTSEFSQDREELDARFERAGAAIALAAKIKRDALAVNKYSAQNVKQHLKTEEKKGKELADLTEPLVYANSLTEEELELYTPVKQDKFAAPKVFTFDEFESIINRREEIEAEIEDIEKASKRIDAIKTEISKLALLRNQLLVYRSIDAPLNSFSDGKHVGCYVGTISRSKLSALKDALNGQSLYEFYSFEDIYSETAFAVLYHKSVKNEIMGIINEFETVKCPFDYEVPSVEQIRIINEQLFELGQECKRISFENAEQGDKLKDIQNLYDYYALEVAKAVAAEKCRATSRTFFMEAWLPAEKESTAIAALNSNDFVVAFEFSDPREDELPPTLTRNNGFVSSFEGVTNMYGVPNYREHDPNSMLSIFYFLFFGIMLGDAGYGILVTIGCFAYLYVSRKTKKQSKMIKMLGFCGISTVLWGIVFGGWFAIENIGFLNAVVWFNPLTEPLKMFVLSLIMGALQELVAFAIAGIYKAQEEKTLLKKLGVLCSNFAWVLVMAAFFFILPQINRILGVTSAEMTASQAQLVSIGKYVAIAGVVLLLLGGILGKKNPLKMLTGIFSNVYGSINVVSDLLSYTRLFGLGLTSAVIGYVLNILASIIISMVGWVGLVIVIPVLVIGHSFNIGINMLGAYVHNARLQFIEFFGHFYDGTGYLYAPLGEQMKYTYIE